MSFRTKTILGIAFIEVLLLGILIAQFQSNLKVSNEHQLHDTVATMKTLIATMARDAVISDDLAALNDLAHSVLHTEDTAYIRILDNQGRVLAEAGDTKALARPFHADASFDEDQDGTYDTSAPIELAGTQVGEIQIGLSIEDLLTMQKDAEKQGMTIAGVELFLVILLSFFLGSYLTRQFEALAMGAKKIAKGQYGYQIPVNGKDEIAQTAIAFNQMTLHLAETMARREAVLQTSLDSIITVDNRRRIVDFNPAAEEVLGYRHEEVAGRDAIDLFVPPHLRQGYSEGLEECLQTDNCPLIGRHFETEVQRADGSICPVEVAITLARQVEGMLFTIYMRDITARLKNEAELRVLSSAVEQSPASVLLMDIDGRIEFVNQKFVDVTGYTVDEVLGRDVSLVHSHRPSTKPYEDMWDSLHANQAWRGELLGRRKDGSEFWESVSVKPMLNGKGEVTHYLAVREDISERKSMEQAIQKSEARFRSLFEQNSSVMLLVEPDTGTIISANPAAADYYGYPLAYLTGMNVQQINTMPTEEIERERQAAWQKKRSYFLFQHRLASGELRDVEVYSTPLQDDKRKLLFSIVHDITDRNRALQALRDTESRLRIFIERFPGAVLIEGVDRRVALVNQTFCDFFPLKMTPSQMVGMNYETRLMESQQMFDDPVHFVLRINELVTERKPVLGELLPLGDGRVLARDYIPIESDGQLIGHVWLYRDVTLQQHAQEKLELEANVFTHAREGIMITDGDRHIVEINEAFTDITGYGRDEVLGKDPKMLSSGRQDRNFYLEMWKRLNESGFWHGELWNRRKNGELYAELLTISMVRDASGQPAQYVGLFTDITEQKHHHEKQLDQAANYDVLTGLINRNQMRAQILRAMRSVQKGGQLLAVIMIDLDDFKEINDRYGHEAGDWVIITTANRLKSVLDFDDAVARVAGDEFVVMLNDLENGAQARERLKHMLEQVAEPIATQWGEVRVTASAGLTFYPQGGKGVDTDQLLRQVDQALYESKRAGKNVFNVFDPELDLKLHEHYQHLARLTSALQHGEFRLYYQPKVDMRSGEILGVEALIRWQHPDEGLLAPAAFLPGIENSPLEIDIDKWVLSEALQQMSAWQKEGMDVNVSVNVSSGHLQEPDFVDQLRTALSKHPEVNPAHLELEILESSALNDLNQIAEIISECQSLGVGFALDDFGTGYSSLSYLKHLAVNTLKIDQSFVLNMLENPRDLTIVEGILALTKDFHRRVIAEGVETEEHGEILLILGCHYAQGFGIARPMPAEKLISWAQNWRPPELWQSDRILDKEQHSIYYALLFHRSWISAIENYLKQGVKELLPNMDHHHCRLGQWLAQEQLIYGKDKEQLNQIDQLHIQLHELATNLVSRGILMTEAEYQSGVEELHRLSSLLEAELQGMLIPPGQGTTTSSP